MSDQDTLAEEVEPSAKRSRKRDWKWILHTIKVCVFIVSIPAMLILIADVFLAIATLGAWLITVTGGNMQEQVSQWGNFALQLLGWAVLSIPITVGVIVLILLYLLWLALMEILFS